MNDGDVKQDDLRPVRATADEPTEAAPVDQPWNDQSPLYVNGAFKHYRGFEPAIGSTAKITRCLVEDAEHEAYCCLHAKDHRDRLIYMAEFMSYLSHIVEENAPDLDYWTQRLFNELQVEIEQLLSGRAPTYFASDASKGKRSENFSYQQWKLYAYVVFFYEVFRLSGMSQSNSINASSEFLKTNNVKIHSSVHSIIKNFRRKKVTGHAKRKAKEDFDWLLKQISLPIKDPYAVCEYHLTHGLFVSVG